MTQDEIIRMAKQCGDWNGETAEFNDVGLKCFAALVAAHEREVCAKLVDNLYHETYIRNIRDCAAAIRARGNHGS